MGLSGDPWKQLAMLPRLDPTDLIIEAREKFNPVAAVALFSGGNDSTVLAHRCQEHYDSLAFIDTGTAIPGVRDFVETFAAWLGKPLIVMESGEAYRRLVLGLHKENPPPGWRPYGFPGPAGHNRAYNQIKERQLRALRAQLQEGHKRGSSVLMLTGLRRGESQRRSKRAPITSHGAIRFVNPLIDWTDLDMRAYRKEWGLPQSDVAALIHRSGECNCGAFAAPGEREMLQSLWPEWFDRVIGSLEREAEARGIGSCRWGTRTEALPDEDAGPLCSDCQLRIELAA